MMNYIFDGKETVLIKLKIDEIIKKSGCDINDIYRYDGSDKTFNEQFDTFINELNTLPFLSDKKIVILRNPKCLSDKSKKDNKSIDEEEKTSQKMLENRKKIINYLLNPILEIDLIIYKDDDDISFNSKFLNEVKKNIKYEKLDKNSNFYNDANILINERKLNITTNARKLLVEYSANSLSELILSLDKLELYPELIDEKVINGLCQKNIENDIFHLINAVFNKDLNNSLMTIRAFKTMGLSIFYVISVFISQVRFYNLVQYLHNHNMSSNQILKITKAKEFRIRLVLDLLHRFSKSNFLEILYELAIFDQTIKSTNNQNHYDNFELFIIKLIGEYHASY